MAKLLKLRRGTTTQHASFTGAEGELTIDTTKDTAVVHDGTTQTGHTLLREDLSNLPAGQIDNADVNASAAIAGTKIAPNFGSQNIATTGTAATGALTVTGNISVSGQVDGVDIATLNNSKNSLSTVNGTILNGVIATTQAQSDNTGKIATTAYVKTAVANVVDSAPGTLDTLNELAAALGDDANYATTTANTIGTKLPKSGGQMTGNITMAGSQTVDGRDLSVDGSKLDGIESGATADQTKSDIDALLIDADTCDGQHLGTSNNVAFQTIDLNGAINSSGAGALYGRNHAYDTVELRGYGGEFMMGAQGTSIHINYRTCNSGASNHTPTEWYWRKGSSSNFSDHHFGNVNANGSITATGNVTAYSDARLKTDIHTINDALSICGKLRGVSYKWIKDGKASIGVIAQEVETVLPEVVETIQENIGTKEEPEYREVKTVDYGKMVGVLINAINELKAEVDELKGGK